MIEVTPTVVTLNAPTNPVVVWTAVVSAGATIALVAINILARRDNKRIIEQMQLDREEVQKDRGERVAIRRREKSEVAALELLRILNEGALAGRHELNFTNKRVFEKQMDMTVPLLTDQTLRSRLDACRQCIRSADPTRFKQPDNINAWVRHVAQLARWDLERFLRDEPLQEFNDPDDYPTPIYAGDWLQRKVDSGQLP